MDTAEQTGAVRAPIGRPAAGRLFRRLQSRAIGPLVQIFHHTLVARAGRRLLVFGRAWGLAVIVHPLAPFPRSFAMVTT